MKTPNKYRVITGPFASEDSFGNNGLFAIPFEGHLLTVIASDGFGWDHVSVSLKNRTPNWEEMCFVKDLFWDKDECACQFHPSESEYVNNHEYCLHLWKPQDQEIQLPPSLMVGIKTTKS